MNSPSASHLKPFGRQTFKESWPHRVQSVPKEVVSERQRRLLNSKLSWIRRSYLQKREVRCVRLVEVWNIVKSPRHPNLVVACPHEQIQDEDGIGEEAVKNLDKRTKGSNQLTERFLERP